MSTYRPHPRWALTHPLATLLVALSIALIAFGASTAAGSQPVAHASGTALRSAIAARAAAHRSLASSTRKLKACMRRHPQRCSAARGALRRSKSRFAKTERLVGSLSATISRHQTNNTVSHSPASPVSKPVSEPVKIPILLPIKVPIVEPVKVPAEPVKTPTEPVKTPTNTKAAPQISVSGQTLTWNTTSGVSKYVFVTKVPGKEDHYSEIGGTSVTPPAVAGATVKYSVRTAVEGSTWAPEVLVSYPGQTQSKPVGTTPPVTTTPSEPTSQAPSEPSSPTSSEPSSPAPSEPAPVTPVAPAGSFEMGVVSGSAPLYELQFIHTVGAHTARVEFKIETTAAEMESTIAGFAADGIRVMPLATFYGTLPTPAQAQNVASWAARFGPGGSFWQGKSYAASTAVTTIEFGNETSYGYQYSDNSTAGYASRAQTYALRFKEAAIATQAANPQVGVLAQGDPGNGSGTAWMDNMFKAVPNLGAYVAGWTVHPYGPNWQTIMDKVLSSAQNDGAPSSIPMYVTEWGLSTDNGRCLEENYGWNKCMTYSEAATTLTTAMNAMQTRYGSRLAGFYLYDANDLAVTGTTTARESYFGALQNSGAPKGAYTTTVETLLNTYA